MNLSLQTERWETLPLSRGYFHLKSHSCFLDMCGCFTLCSVLSLVLSIQIFLVSSVVANLLNAFQKGLCISRVFECFAAQPAPELLHAGALMRREGRGRSLRRQGQGWGPALVPSSPDRLSNVCLPLQLPHPCGLPLSALVCWAFLRDQPEGAFSLRL